MVITKSPGRKPSGLVQPNSHLSENRWRYIQNEKTFLIHYYYFGGIGYIMLEISLRGFECEHIRIGTLASMAAQTIATQYIKFRTGPKTESFYVFLYFCLTRCSVAFLGLSDVQPAQQCKTDTHFLHTALR